ncbi:MAG: antibiotic biosynthesis monooxygenase [Desulfurococcales archaeon]|nr:antibiotic biosynthesis monooxygenase [Desulfurococcales archaeon]MCE4627337.1 antibiotic biosynthesis monooxygenase [Desulfurococcales archaeon]MCE4629091.1 antibiotic biosynthesis monooxygenase [Desulfurococcales archaeon]
MSVAIINRITVDDKETLEKVVDRFRNRAGLVDKMDGFLGIELLVDEEDLEIMVVTRWRDMDSLNRWLNSPEFKKAHTGDRSGSGLNARSSGKVYISIDV